MRWAANSLAAPGSRAPAPRLTIASCRSENINWHYGFGAAGVGMTLGVIQYAMGGKFLGSAGLSSTGTPADYRLLQIGKHQLALRFWSRWRRHDTGSHSICDGRQIPWQRRALEHRHPG